MEGMLFQLFLCTDCEIVTADDPTEDHLKPGHHVQLFGGDNLEKLEHNASNALVIFRFYKKIGGLSYQMEDDDED